MSHASLTVDIGAIRANWQALNAKVPSAAVVKADAYGLGAEAVVPALIEAGCRRFFVATVEEGVALASSLAQGQQRSGGADALALIEIYIFHGIASREEGKICQQSGLIPVINSPAQWEYWQTAPSAYALHVDSGMNRLGFSAAELQIWIEKHWPQAAGRCQFLMSHLACAERSNHPLNALQLQRFKAARALLPQVPASLANSSGVFLNADYHADFARPGCAIYGINPTPLMPNPMRQVARLSAPILQLQTAGKDEETVSYGASYAIAKGARIATVGLGYADGYLRALSNKGQAILAGKRVPIAGIVTMDMMMLDVSTIPENALGLGMEAEFIGSLLTVDEVAGKAGTIGYELFTRLGARVKKQYITQS